jgi:thioredoxin 1
MESAKFNELINSSQPVVIDFYAQWCGPCKAMKPVLENLKARIGDKAKIVKIDVDDNQAIASQLGIRSIPTLMIYQNGEVKWKKIGASNVAEMETAINKLT